MEEKEPIKVKLSTAIMAFTIILLIVGILLYYNKGEENKNEGTTNGNYGATTEYDSQNSNTNTAKSEENATISSSENSTTNNTNSNTSSTSNEDITQQCKSLLEEYENILAIRQAESINVLSYFKLISDKDILNLETVEKGSCIYAKTNIKYSDYKKAILEYITYDLFEEDDEHWSTPYFINEDGYLWVESSGASGYSIKINTMTLVEQEDNEYTFKYTYTVTVDEEYDTTFSGEVTFENTVNGLRIDEREVY